MIKTYQCPTCGYAHAVWKLRVNTSALTLCENCLPMFSNKYSRINSFKLNNHKQKDDWRNTQPVALADRRGATP